jgi:hypothetical protein
LLILALSTEQDQEALAARRSLKKELLNGGQDLHKFAARCSITDADLKKIFDAGYEKGAKDEKSATEAEAKTHSATESLKGGLNE